MDVFEGPQPQVVLHPACCCGHIATRHHGDDRSGSPIAKAWPGTGCKDCRFCDYYKPVTL